MRHNQASAIAERYNNYSALVTSVFLQIIFFFVLNLTFVYEYTICMAWRFHFPIRKYDFKGNNANSVSMIVCITPARLVSTRISMINRKTYTSHK